MESVPFRKVLIFFSYRLPLLTSQNLLAATLGIGWGGSLWSLLLASPNIEPPPYTIGGKAIKADYTLDAKDLGRASGRGFIDVV